MLPLQFDFVGFGSASLQADILRRGYGNGSLTTKAILQSEELRVQFRQRFAKLCQLLFRTVDLQSDEFCNLERFVEQLSDVLQMRQRTFGVGIAFPAMSLVTAKTKSIVKALWFPTGLAHELLTEFLKRVQPAVGHSEVRNDSAARIFCRHIFSLSAEPSTERQVESRENG